MPYPLTLGMSKATFKSDIIDCYFPLLDNKLPGYADDYAAIGAFLTRTDEVKAALRPLEGMLRTQALENAKRLATSGPLPTQNASIYEVKKITSKILSGALAGIETRAGFNGAASGLLHNNSLYGSGSGDRIDLTAEGRTTDGLRGGARNVALPQGVPKVIGSIAPMDFMVLLKHGYACKDVGAESAHGEFTHRLQWCAIIEAKANLRLTHHPIDLYKKMWLTATQGTANLAGNRALYMWMALLDNVNSDDEAANLNTMAWSGKTFNNPEYMNRTLSQFAMAEVFHPTDDSDLYVLRKLLLARKMKRSAYDATTKYHARKMTDPLARRTVLAAANSAPGTTRLQDLQNVVAWIESL